MTSGREPTFELNITLGSQAGRAGANPAGGAEEQGRELQARLFAVGADPYCVWDWNLHERNIEYLESLDPDYFDYVGRVNSPQLDSEHADERRRAATAIRTAYHHGLESFFALLFATLQAPWCVVGWMQVYSPAGLREMVRAAVPSLWGKGERRDQVLAFREKLLPFLWPQPRSFVRWEGISRAILPLNTDEEEAAKIQGLFGELWHELAKDLVNDAFVSEYNSIKHGLRTGAGGFYMLIGPESAEGDPPPPEAMHSLGDSEHGSSFFTPRTFVGHPEEKDKRARPGHGRNKDSHFRIRRQMLNWDPRGLCKALTLISASIHNVRSFALWKNGSDPSKLRFTIPEEAHFRGPLGLFPGIGSSDIDGAVLKEAVQIIERGPLEEALTREFDELRERWDPAADAGR